MIESRYNVFVPETEGDTEGPIIAFNSMTCALAKMTRKDFNTFESGRGDGFSQIGEELRAQLLHGHFLIEDDYNELDILKYRLLQSRYSTNYLSMTIAPTMGCNFDCVYCYESDHSDHSKMSSETQDALINELSEQIKLNGIKSFHVVWYGGEPLLAMDVIASLSKRIIPLCEENDVIYSAQMITNGYLLSKPAIETINKCRITSIQITIDGPKDIHDARRYITGGIPTYDKIVSNLFENLDTIPHVALRINADKSNYDRVSEVKELFDDPRCLNKITTYIAIVDAPNDEYDGCLSMLQFSKLESKFYPSAMRTYPYPHTNACGADAQQSMVVGPDGAIYKCWNDIGVAALSVGNINNMSAREAPKLLLDYILYNATEDAECSQCQVLPFCMGGCPHRRLVKSEIRCPQHKYDLETYIRRAAQELTEQKSKSVGGQVS